MTRRRKRETPEVRALRDEEAELKREIKAAETIDEQETLKVRLRKVRTAIRVNSGMEFE